MGYREDLLARVDVPTFFARLGIDTKPLANGELQFKCPFHEDTQASANINTKTMVWFCHAEARGGSLIDMLMERDHLAYREATARLEEWFGKNGGARSGVSPDRAATPRATQPSKRNLAKLTEDNIAKWHASALRNDELMAWFRDHRGFTDETVELWQLGWDGQRVLIPIRDANGELVNVRRYLRDAGPDDNKMLPLVSGSEAATRLFPVAALQNDEVIWVEGEWDAMLMWQQGFENTITATIGTGNFKPEWTDLFAGKSVLIIPDNDDAGRHGAARIAGILSGVATVGTVNVPGLPDKGDMTDFFVAGRDPAELRALLTEAVPYVVAALEIEEADPIDVPLALASEAIHRGERLAIPVLLSGKAMTPYTVPKLFNVVCNQDNKRLCATCPLNDLGGHTQVRISAQDPKVLNLIAVTDEQQYKAVKALAKVVPACNRPKVEVIESANVEELRVIPELDVANDAGESEYVSRTAYFIGHGLRSNRSYKFVGYTHPLPKSQATVHLISEAVPAQDNISAFDLNADIYARLRIFQADPGQLRDRLEDIYGDLRRNVHRIAGRMEMQLAYDLAWHSVISFYFNGTFVRRGWVEVMVLGDSGQGKTEMAMGLIGHYRLGERVQGEQASGAGLIGGLEKMNETWILGWGRIPLNDKRLLVIDETQGLQSGQIESMSDVRATGVAEITKIRTERTNARCRIVWLANPASGRPLAQYNQGVLALKDVFKKPEDIRRLDLVLGVASGDVSLTEINARHDAPTAPKYDSAACRDLVLWAWSRGPNQVKFESEAVTAILAAATAMGRKYHPSLPIVEPADQRLKIARLAVAIAARVFSTDDGENVIVTREHVEFVRDYLDQIYGSRALAYDEYSSQMKSGEEIDDDARVALVKEMADWPSEEAAIAFFRQAKVFRRTELEEVVGWDSSTAKDVIKRLTSYRLVRTTRDGYMKTPAFIGLLRNLTAVPEDRVAKAAEQVEAELGERPF